MARILIVEDEESDRLILETLLTGAGHDVSCTASGESALRQHLEEGVDLVVTDLEMPEVHGLELISIFRDVLPSPPVIAVSGKGPLQLHLARLMGAVATVEKPIDPRRLLEAVDEGLASDEAASAG